MVGIHPIIAFFIYETIKESKQDFGILNKGGVRSNREQAKLYAQGRTAKGQKVTWTRNSFHQYGLAADLVAFVNGKPSWDVKKYKEITRAGKAVIKKYDLPIDHGYDLWGRDLPHWQVSKLGGRDARKVYDIRKIDPKRFLV